MSHPKDFISIADWSREELEALLARAHALKRERAARTRVDRAPDRPLHGRSVLLYFEKPSLRTYVTFGVGVSELGGTPIYLPAGQVNMGDREPIQDVARNLERWCDAIVARTYSHELVEGLAAHACVPVINALTDLLHPCQALTDVMTIAEHGDLAKDRLVYVGDGNNVAHSLMYAAGVLGMSLTVCTPERYRPDATVTARARALATASGGDIAIEDDPMVAVRHAAFVYTDVWASMGREAEAEARAAVFRPYQVNAELMARAPGSARVLHCLPAHRGEEISEDVLESEQFLGFEQAENRLHAQKAVLETLLSDRPALPSD